MSDQVVQEEPGKNPAEEPAKEDSNASSPGGTATAVFNDDITIYTGHRLNHLDQGAIKAYAAQGKGKAPARLFVLVCEPDLTPRSIKAANYASIINPTLARLVVPARLVELARLVVLERQREMLLLKIPM